MSHYIWWDEQNQLTPTLWWMTDAYHRIALRLPVNFMNSLLSFHV